MRTRIQDQANNNFQILRELSMREKTQNITNNTGTRAHTRDVKSKTNFERAIEKREEMVLLQQMIQKQTIMVKFMDC